MTQKDSWFYLAGERQVGPLSRSELKAAARAGLINDQTVIIDPDGNRHLAKTLVKRNAAAAKTKHSSGCAAPPGVADKTTPTAPAAPPSAPPPPPPHPLPPLLQAEVAWKAPSERLKIAFEIAGGLVGAIITAGICALIIWGLFEDRKSIVGMRVLIIPSLWFGYRAGQSAITWILTSTASERAGTT